MIRIVGYRAAWPARFEAEARRLRRSLGTLALRIEHVGSTSVPGLAAKPVIDIQISVASLEPLSDWADRLHGLGYVFVPRGDFDRVYPFFQRPAAWPSTHHIHLCMLGDEQERLHLVFRDHLRRYPEVAATYAELKRELAQRFVGNSDDAREKYSLAKTDFIAAVLRRADAEGSEVPPARPTVRARRPPPPASARRGRGSESGAAAPRAGRPAGTSKSSG